ncbi:MAG: hypothetical protein ACREFR_01465 [Limisphaerales bacterium]
MNPLIPLFIGLAETLLETEPQIVAAVEAILAKKDPTPADWLALRQKVLAKSYADYVPASALTSGSPGALAAVASPAPATSAPISQASAQEPAPYLADGTPNRAFVSK